MGERAELHDLAFSYMVERGPDIRKSSDSGIDARRSVSFIFVITHTMFYHCVYCNLCGEIAPELNCAIIGFPI